MTEPAPAAQTEPPSTSRLLGVGAGISAGAATLFLLLRVMAVAYWHWPTAFAVASSIDLGDALPIAFGTLFAQPVFTGILLLALLPLAVVAIVWPIEGGPRATMKNVLLVTALTVCAISLIVSASEWWIILGAVLTAAAVVGLRLLWRRGRGRAVIGAALRHVGSLTGVAVLVLAAVVTTPWTPLERIHTEQGTVDAYVLDVEPGFMTILTAKGHRLEILTTSDVVRRADPR